MCRYQIYMEAHAQEGDDDIEVGEEFGETEIAMVTMAVIDRPNMEVGEDRRCQHSRVGAGGEEASAPHSEEEDSAGEEEERKNVDESPC